MTITSTVPIAQGASTDYYSGQRGDHMRTNGAEPDRSTEPIELRNRLRSTPMGYKPRQ